MGDPEKKRLKAEAKRAKKLAKAEAKAAEASAAIDSTGVPPPATGGQGTSTGVRFAELVRGVLYVVLGGSLIVALILGQRGAILSFDDIVENLFAAWTGKVILAVIALGFVIYGLKHLRIVR